MGFFKSNVASLMGTLYEKDDSRRDGGFTIYYMGINIGGLLAALIAGVIVEWFGWSMGFGFAAIGMYVVFKAIDSVLGLRVSHETELRGLDLDEHGMESYSGFQIFTTE